MASDTTPEKYNFPESSPCVRFEETERHFLPKVVEGNIQAPYREVVTD